jgi:acetylornithine deacetylase/succinyl-diaminopimelate desuccinylase-like protein
MPVRKGAVAKLGRALRVLDQRRLPIHITPPVRSMFEAVAKVLPGASGQLIRQILNPAFTDLILKTLGSRGVLFAPLVRNTISPTVIHASEKVNVIPSQVELGMDGRLLPGLKPEVMLAEVSQLLGKEAEIELIRSDPGPAEANMGLFDTLGGILTEFDPEGKPIPFVMMGVTDARWFSKLGIQTYGFTPMKLPQDYNFMQAAHAADERIPVDAIDFGMQAIFKAMQRFS